MVSVERHSESFCRCRRCGVRVWYVLSCSNTDTMLEAPALHRHMYTPLRRRSPGLKVSCVLACLALAGMRGAPQLSVGGHPSGPEGCPPLL